MKIAVKYINSEHKVNTTCYKVHRYGLGYAVTIYKNGKADRPLFECVSEKEAKEYARVL